MTHMACCKTISMTVSEIWVDWGRVAQRITRLTTDQKIAGSNPAVLESNIFFMWNIFSSFQILFIDIHSYANDLKAFQFFKGEYEKYKINNIADMWATGPLGKISFTLRVLAMGGSWEQCREYQLCISSLSHCVLESTLVTTETD